MTIRFVGCAVAVLALVGVTEAQQDTSLKAVLTALKAKRSRDVSEAYTFAFERTVDSSVFSATGKMTKCGASKDFTVEWSSGKFRLHDKNTCDDAYEMHKIFDGVKTHTKFKYLDAKGVAQGDWKYGVITGDHRERPFGIEYWPIFFARGILPNSASQKFYPGHLRFDPPDDRFFLHRSVGKTVVLRSFPEATNQQPYYEYTIDIAKDHSVTQMSYSLGNDRKDCVITIDLKQRGNTWVPNAWRSTEYVGAKVSQVTSVTVADYGLADSVPKETFELAFLEGAKVGGTDLKLAPDKKTTSFEFSDYENRDGKLIKLGGSPLSSWIQGNWYWLALGSTLLTLGIVRIRTSRSRSTTTN